MSRSSHDPRDHSPGGLVSADGARPGAPAAPLVGLLGGDRATRAALCFLLRDEGCAVVEATTAAALVASFRPRPADLVAIIHGPADDLGATMALLHQLHTRPPVALLTRSADAAVRRRAFGLGVRDIISLPSAPRDLRARLGAMLRDQHHAAAPRPPSPMSVHAGGLILRLDRREVCDETGWTVRLTPREAVLLHALMGAPGRPLGRQELLDVIWGERYDGDGNALEVYVRRLRTKLAGAGTSRQLVRTLRGEGYLFDARQTPRVAPRAEDAPHVLYVADPGDARVTQTLRHAGYRVAQEVGARMLAAARGLRPMLVVIEDGDGEPDAAAVELSRRLRTDTLLADLPVIVCAPASSLRRDRAELAANDYLTTPVDRDELLLRVERLIGPVPSALLAASPA